MLFSFFLILFGNPTYKPIICVSENNMPGNEKRRHVIILTHTSAFFNCQSQNSVKHTLLVNFLNVLHIWFFFKLQPGPFPIPDSWPGL